MFRGFLRGDPLGLDRFDRLELIDRGSQRPGSHVTEKVQRLVGSLFPLLLKKPSAWWVAMLPLFFDLFNIVFPFFNQVLR